MVMTDHYFHNGRDSFDSRYSDNSDSVYSGLDFIKNEQLTWAPWGYIYRRDFLLENNLKFEEHVRFEDADFAIRCISYARRIFYCPVSLVHYSCYEDSQTGFGKDTREIIGQMMQHDHRIRKEYLRISQTDAEAGEVIRQQARGAFKIGMRRFIWLPFKDKHYLTQNYIKGYFTREDGGYLWFASTYPLLYSAALSAVSPILRQIVKFKRWRRLR